MFEDSLSKRKIKMLANYREIEDIMEEKSEENQHCIKDIIRSPRIIDRLDAEMSQYYKEKFEKI